MMQKIKISIIFVVLLAINFMPGITLGDIIDDLKPGHWLAIPNSALEDAGVYPSSWLGDSGPYTIITAYGGGAYDTKRDRFIVWGGGHGNYSGNEVYTFDIKTFTWERIWGPTPNSQVRPQPDNWDPCYATYLDGNPSSRHTYDGMEYLPVVDKMYGSGGASYCGTGGNYASNWLFDFNNLNNPWDNFNTDTQSSLFTAYDPVKKVVYYINRLGNLTEYNPVNGNSVIRGTYEKWSSDFMATMVYHPSSQLLLMIGQYMGNSCYL
jgi:hypothetical protein